MLCEREEGNLHDPYAVGVWEKSTGEIVGHVPRKISAACSLFLRKNGTILCTVTGKRRFSEDLPQGGLEVPSKLIFQGEVKYVEKMKKLLTPAGCNSVAPEISDDEQHPKTRKAVSDEVVTVDDGEIAGNFATPTVLLSLSYIVLTDEDRRMIVTGVELNDKHINYGQTLIKKQFGYIGGLTSTLLLSSRKYLLLGSGALQIIHTHGNHWIDFDHWV